MRLSSTLSSRILKTSSDGDSTTSLGRLFQWLIALTVRNVFLIRRWNLSHCNLYPLPLVSSTWLLVKREPPLPVQMSFKYWSTVMRFPPSLVFFREKRPNPLSLSLQSRFSSPLIIFVALLWTLFRLYLFWIVGIRTGHSTPAEAWPAPMGMITSPSLLVAPRGCSPWSCSPLLLQQCTADPCSASCPPEPPGPFSARLLPSHTDLGSLVISPQVWDLAPISQTLCYSCLSTVSAYPGVSESWLSLLPCPPNHLVQCHQQTWWGCFQSHPILIQLHINKLYADNSSCHFVEGVITQDVDLFSSQFLLTKSRVGNCNFTVLKTKTPIIYSEA